MIVTRKTTRAKGPLVIPREMLTKVGGWGRRRIHVIITDPRSRHFILTRYPEKHKIWSTMTIERDSDFIPTVMLKKAKVHGNKNFSIEAVDGDLIVRRDKTKAEEIWQRTNA